LLHESLWPVQVPDPELGDRYLELLELGEYVPTLSQARKLQIEGLAIHPTNEIQYLALGPALKVRGQDFHDPDRV
jgi:hypothetical protein